MTHLVVAFAVGVVSHKVWRVGWSIRRGARPGASLRREFAPSDLQTPAPKRDRPRSVTEIGV